MLGLSSSGKKWYVGTSLRSVLQTQVASGTRFSESTIWRLAYGILKALAFMHTPSSSVQKLTGQYCFVHGHITPDTVFLSTNQMPRIGSLHCCTLTSCCLPNAETGGRFKPYLPLDIDSSIFPPLITPGYEPLVDIWSLGILLLQACAVPRGDLRSNYSEEIADFIDKLLVEDDRIRPTATEALQNPKFTELDTEYISRGSSYSAHTEVDFKEVSSVSAPLLALFLSPFLSLLLPQYLLSPEPHLCHQRKTRLRHGTHALTLPSPIKLFLARLPTSQAYR